MKTKGSYTGAIAIIAIVIMAIISFGMVSTREAAAHENEAGAIIEAKWEMQNAHHLVGKVFADAIADSGVEQGCAFDLAEVDTKANTYFTASFTNYPPLCSVQNVAVTEVIANNATVEFDLQCSKEVGGIVINYTRKGFTFDKQTYYDLSTGSCLVDVEDNDTGECDVDTIDTVTTLVGCGN